jgi:hypothetical protein
MDTARDTLLAELLDGENPNAPEYADARARIERMIDDHRAQVLTEAASELDRIAGQVEAAVAEYYGKASGIGPGSAAMVREAAKTVRARAAGVR